MFFTLVGWEIGCGTYLVVSTPKMPSLYSIYKVNHLKSYGDILPFIVSNKFKETIKKYQRKVKEVHLEDFKKAVLD